MKVLHISGAKSWGGNEQQLIYLIEQLNRLGVAQSLFCYENTKLCELAGAYEINVITIPRLKPYNKAYRKLLKKCVIENNFDLLHLHTSDSVTGYVITDILMRLKTKTVFSKKGISRKISALSKYKYNYKNIHKILCVSQVVLNHFEEVLYAKNHSKLCVVYDGVKVENEVLASDFNIRREFDIDNETKIIGNIANHTRAKDLPTLIKTLHALIYEKNFKDIHMIQIGEFSKLTPELQELVKDLKLEDYISFIGFKTQASLLLPQFDVYLMTSEREGGPTTVLEAFYKKVPVVSTEVGIVGEAIEDAKNGFLTQVGDVAALADKLKILLESSSLSTKFKEISYQQFILNYTAKKLGNNTYQIYKEIVG
ncbi:glycosyltransferase [Aquimarina addita]|uniref:Glycosyltransferase n=1 Tax=Aquimarina addita TaxID=870485 RepID=A0ABP6UN91_9FLAO